MSNFFKVKVSFLTGVGCHFVLLVDNDVTTESIGGRGTIPWPNVPWLMGEIIVVHYLMSTYYFEPYEI